MLLNIDPSNENGLPSLKSLKAGNKIQNILKSQKIVKRKKSICKKDNNAEGKL